MSIYYTILSLKNKEREEIIKSNLDKFPFFTVTQSVNGYNTYETVDELKKTELSYHKLDQDFDTYGTLANFLTKYKILLYQIEHKLEYVCFIEDDLLLESNFIVFVENIIHKFIDNKINMIRLGKWGEGYITSLSGAKNIVNKINQSGIIRNIDNQLRIDCGPEYYCDNTPWMLVVATNEGDCLKTQKIVIDN